MSDAWDWFFIVPVMQNVNMSSNSGHARTKSSYEKLEKHHLMSLKAFLQGWKIHLLAFVYLYLCKIEGNVLGPKYVK